MVSVLRASGPGGNLNRKGPGIDLAFSLTLLRLGRVWGRQVQGSCESHSGTLKQCPGWQSRLLWLDAIGWEPGTGDWFGVHWENKGLEGGGSDYLTASAPDLSQVLLYPITPNPSLKQISS